MESEYLFRTNDVIVGDVFRDKHGHRWRIIEIVLTVNPDIARTAVRNVPEWELEDNK
jgi:hypothetical protein